MVKLRYWLFKSEPSEFSIEDLAALPHQTTAWNGVRNYQARNLLRDQVRIDDELFFYHSSTDLKGLAGVCRVVRAAYPDPSAFDKASPYFDSKATPDNPIWVAVDVALIRRFDAVVPLALLKRTKGLEKMMLCQPGSRLSIQPVTVREWRMALRLAGG
jgi:predicted RNA-binding protein with PUA-like domain